MIQRKDDNFQYHYEQFKNTIKVIKYCGGDIGMERAIIYQTLTLDDPPIYQGVDQNLREAEIYDGTEDTESYSQEQ